MKQLTLLFLREDDQILLAMKKRGFGEGRWNGVGGKLEPGETTEQAVVRECEEEISVTPSEFYKVAEIIFDEQHQGSRELLQVHAFICTKWSGEPTESEEMAPKWFSVDAIPYDEMWADDPHWLPLVLAGKKLQCTFELDQNDQITQKTVTEVGSFSL